MSSVFTALLLPHCLTEQNDDEFFRLRVIKKKKNSKTKNEILKMKNQKENRMQKLHDHNLPRKIFLVFFDKWQL